MGLAYAETEQVLAVHRPNTRATQRPILTVALGGSL